MIPNFAVSAIATATDLNIVVNYPARDRPKAAAGHYPRWDFGFDLPDIGGN